jgi:ribulose-phosphate 3-epimerase
MKPYRIAPSVLSADFAKLADEIRSVEAAGADLIHVDVMDGHFVPNLTIGPPVVARIRTVTRLPLDVHLMIERPDEFAAAFVDAGADWISVHAEACVHLHRSVQALRSAGVRPGVALNPATPLSAIEHVLPDLDFVLVMTVNPGFPAQRFIDSTLPKVAALRDRIDRAGLDVEIEVDGGISPVTAAAVRAAGAEVFVAGNAIFAQPDRAAAVRALRSALDTAASLG